MRIALALGLGLWWVVPAGAAELSIDGLAEESVWSTAASFDGLTRTQPETGEPVRYPTRVRYLALPEGLAFFFECDQPEAEMPRRAPRQQRDRLDGADRVNVMVDFDGNGQQGYNFTLSRANSIEDNTISNENRFNRDWDGLWFHAVREREGGWDAELLIPWTSVFMRDDGGERRSIGLYVDRVLGAVGERAARPPILFFRPQFLSQFERVEIDVHRGGLLRFYPYLSVFHDRVDGRSQTRGGLDLYYKPSSSLQLTATINPDFGQVESDDLVVNFDALEVFFSDKRPFFTENQSAFVLQSPEEEPLVYTRRIGAARDDGRGVADIDAGVKLNGSAAGWDYGLFTVSERDADEVGKRFGVLRLKRPGASFDFGYLGTLTDRPFLDRQAQVHAVDAEWRLPGWVFRGVALASRRDAPGDRDGDGQGGWFTALWQPSSRFDARFDVLHYAADLDFNDVGFQRRRDWRLFETRAVWRYDTGSEHGLRNGTLTWNVDWPEDASGRMLRPYTDFNLYGEFADGGSAFVDLEFQRAGLDDLISRGNGRVRVGGGVRLFGEYKAARRGDWQPQASVFLSQDDLIGSNREGYLGVKRWFGDAMTLELGALQNTRSDRLYWRRDTLFGRYEADQTRLISNLEWFIGQQQELRLKFQWIGFSAREGQAWRLHPDAILRRSAEPVDNFGLNSLGVQLRYRYRLGPESDVFVVYSRGGESRELESDRSYRLFDEALDLRDADQLLVKLRLAY